MALRRVRRFLVIVVLTIAVNLGLFGFTTVLSQEREREQDITDPVSVSLVSLKPPEPPQQEEVKDPEPPPPQERPDFAPDLVQPGLGDMAGPSIGVTFNVGGMQKEGPVGDFIFDSLDLDRVPEVLARVNPDYPYQARERGIEGYVAVKVLVGKDGEVRQVNILKSKPKGVFDQTVRKAMPGWRFQPGEVGGEPVTAWVTTTLHFRLN